MELLPEGYFKIFMAFALIMVNMLEVNIIDEYNNAQNTGEMHILKQELELGSLSLRPVMYQMSEYRQIYVVSHLSE